MDWWLAFAIVLYLLTAGLIIAEVFVPSGGIISVCALLCLIGGIAIFFHHSNTAGYIGIGLAIVMIPLVVIMSYKVLPHTKFGKTVMLRPSDRTIGDAVPDTLRLQGLLGKTAVVVSPLRPVGMCDFSGERIECVAESGYVDKGIKVEVIRVEGTQLTVRALTT